MSPEKKATKKKATKTKAPTTKKPVRAPRKKKAVAFDEIHAPIRGKRGTEHYYVTKNGNNGQILTTSEMYSSKHNCLRAARAFYSRHKDFKFVLARPKRRIQPEV